MWRTHKYCLSAAVCFGWAAGSHIQQVRWSQILLCRCLNMQSWRYTPYGPPEHTDRPPATCTGSSVSVKLKTSQTNPHLSWMEFTHHLNLCVCVITVSVCTYTYNSHLCLLLLLPSFTGPGLWRSLIRVICFPMLVSRPALNWLWKMHSSLPAAPSVPDLSE